MKIGIAYDLTPTGSPPGTGPDDLYEEYDQPETIAALVEVIHGLGHEAIQLGNGRGFLERVLAAPPDFVFNIAEGEGASRSREARVPAVLELLGIPYSGSDPLTLAVGLDKSVARTLVHAAGVMVPRAVSVQKSVRPAELVRTFKLVSQYRPLIVKPVAEGSSKGIRENRSLVESLDQFLEAVFAIHNAYEQPALVEEYIEGEELTVGLLGPGSELKVLGIMKVIPSSPEARFVYSVEVKRDWRRRVRYEVPAQLADEDRASVATMALRAANALGCRDLGRVDFRLRHGVPYFLEANPLPGLSPERSDLVILARGLGLSYSDLIERVLQSGLYRAGLASESEPRTSDHGYDALD